MSVWNFKDLTGMTFGRLTVIERAKNANDGHARWLCRCSCGNLCIVLGKHLISGKIQSCGCLGREKSQHKTFNGLYKSLSHLSKADALVL